jgi:hypothetical protein
MRGVDLSEQVLLDVLPDGMVDRGEEAEAADQQIPRRNKRAKMLTLTDEEREQIKQLLLENSICEVSLWVLSLVSDGIGNRKASCGPWGNFIVSRSRMPTIAFQV